MTIKLYSSWLCPYAQRVWCALNEYGVSYELIESFEFDQETFQYIKHPELLKHNPKGLVPTLVEIKPDDEQTVVKCESIDILKDLCSTYVNKEEAEYHIVDCQTYNQCICSPFYGALMKADPEERLQSWNEMLKGLELFSKQLTWERKNDDDDDEPLQPSFYKGTKDRPTIVDLTVFPWVHRLFLLDHFKSLSLDGTEGNSMSQESKDKIIAWKNKMEHCPSVKNTLAEPEKLIEVHVMYSKRKS